MKEFLEKAVRDFLRDSGDKALRSVATPYLQEELAGDETEKAGAFASNAAQHLMRLLYAARVSRPDLMVGVTRLAHHVSRWKERHDRALRRLMAYVAATADLTLQGTLSTADSETVEVHLYPDADLVGEKSSSRSTSGLCAELAAPAAGHYWPLSWSSRRQTATASSTCEAETMSLSSAMRKEGAPLQQLYCQLLGRPVTLRVHEDNTQCIQAVRRGYSPSLRHLARTQRVALGSLNEFFFGEKGLEEQGGQAFLQHCGTCDHKGDVFTKSLQVGPFERAREMLGLRPGSTAAAPAVCLRCFVTRVLSGM